MRLRDAKILHNYMNNKEMAKKKVFVRTFGCQMNVRDSEVVKGLLLAEGYKLTDDEKKADIILFNTCSVRQHAEDKVWSALGNIKPSRPQSIVNSQQKKQIRRPSIVDHRPIIGVIGCMAQNYKKEILRRAPHVDIVCGTSNIDQLPKMLKIVTSHALSGTGKLQARSKNNKIIETQEQKRPEEIYHTGFREDKKHAYVVISEGCDNYCTYCIVPYVRGRLRHRPAEEILKEIKDATRAGIDHITLLGQNVNSYIYEGRGTKDKRRTIDFVELLKIINDIKGVKEFWFMTSHPKDVDVEFLKTMAACDKLKKTLHLPLQAGSDRILKMMNRGYSAKRYLEIVDQYRSIVYNGQLSTDFIVGFPGETDEDFEKTYKLARRVCFDSAYIFKYSPRPNTKAIELKDDVTLEVKKQRHALLLELQKKTAHAKRKKTN